MGCGKQRETTLVKLQPLFLNLRWKTCLRQNCSHDSCACSEGPALGQNTLMMILQYENLDTSKLLNESHFNSIYLFA